MGLLLLLLLLSNPLPADTLMFSEEPSEVL